MGEIYKVESVKELISFISNGYRFNVDQIQDIFNLSKTKYYDYIYNNVNVIKIPSKVRENIIYSELGSLTAYDRSVVERVKLLNESTLLSADEVHEYLFDNELIYLEFYDNDSDEYHRIDEDIIASHDDYIASVVMKSQTRKNHKAVGQSDRPGTYNEFTNKSRFHAGIKKCDHIRLVILGVYSYYILKHDESRDSLDEIFYKELKRQTFFSKKFS